MQTHEFGNLGELEEAANSLARASRHPLYADLGRHVEGPADGSDDGSDVRDPRRMAKYVIWNNRDDRPAYFGSERYNLIQHREVIDAIREAVANTEGSIEKGVIHDYGSKVDGVLVFGDQDKANVDVTELVDTSGDSWTDGYVPPEGADWTKDRLGLGMRFQNSFDGRTKVGASTMGYRFICGNWMVWGEEVIASDEDLHIKGDEEAIGVDPEFFEDVIHEVFDEKEHLETVVGDATEELFPIDVAPDLLQAAGFGKGYAREITHQLLQMDQPREGYTTRWHVYNAATTHVDHVKAKDIGPSVYQRHHESAWDVLKVKLPEQREDPVNPRAFARPPTA